MSDKRFVLAGVMGWPVAHTRSPAIHNHWIAKHELKGAYVQLPVQPENLEAAIRGKTEEVAEVLMTGPDAEDDV